MLIDHEVRIAQVFQIEGDLDEAIRQKILAKTRGKLLSYASRLQAEIIESLSECGAKTAGKVRYFAQVTPYEHPQEAEWEPVNVQSPLQESGEGASNCSVQRRDDGGRASMPVEGGPWDDVETPKAVGRGNAEAFEATGATEAKGQTISVHA